MGDKRIIIFQTFTHQDQTQKHFEIGRLQSSIIKNYFELEREYFYYEKLLEYNEYKAIKEFSQNGAIPEKCNNKWKFNDGCEPDFKEYFKEILNKDLENKEIDINSDIEVYFKDFDLPTKTNTAEVEYKGKIIVKKQPLINFQELETLKLCIKDNIKEIAECNPESNIGDIYTFKKEITEILNENLEKEKIFLTFNIDIKNPGLTTSIF